MDFNELKKKYDTNNKRKLLFLMRKNSKNGVSYEDIDKGILNGRGKKGKKPDTHGNIGKLLTSLKEDNLVDIEIINHSRKGIRKRFILNSIGQELADCMVLSGLKDDEIRLFNFLKEMKNLHDKYLAKDFWDITAQFYEYGFNENGSLFSEMVRHYMKEIRKFFKYETEFNHVSDVEQKITQE